MKKFLLSVVVCFLAIVSFGQTPITGTFVLCQGSTVTLSNATSGGTWSSSNVGIASVGSSTGVVFGNAAGVATITYSMGSTWFVTQNVTVNPLPGAITSTSTAGMFVCVGDNITLTNPTPGGTWSSNNTSIATIGSSSGVVTGVSSGTVIISYILPTGCFATSLVMVSPTPGPITGPNQVCVGSSIVLTGTGGGTWSSGTPSVATVGSGSGVVTGVSAGTVLITYMLSTGCYVTYPVTVNPVPTPIIGTPGTPGISICVGGTITLTNGVSGGVWSSGTPAVATVGSSSGVVTGVAVGTATITYMLSTGCFATTIVSVTPTPTITGPTQVCVGSTIILSGSGGGTWSSGSPTVASVGSGTGIVTGVSAGVAVITYMLPTGCFATHTVTVDPTPSIIVGPLRLCVGDVVTLMSTPPGGVWTSGTPSVATIGSSSGTVTAVAPGTSTITYTLPGGCFVTAIVTVNPLPGAITGPSTVCVGSTITLGATPPGGTWISGSTTVATVGAGTGIVTGVSAGTTVITYMLATGCMVTTTITVNPTPVIGLSTGTRLCVGNTLTLPATPTGGIWTSSNTGVATVGSSSGIITGVTPGVVTITYTLSTGCFATATITVDPTPVITGPNTMCAGSSVTLTATPAGGTWSSGSPTIATVGSSSGVVTGVSAGVAVITYMLPTGCFATYSVTVNHMPSAIASSTGLPLGPICVGNTLTLFSSPTGGIWTSANTSVATVGSSSGVVTGVAPGTSVITYTLSGGCFVTYTVTVNPNPVITGPNTVCAGSSITLTGTPPGGNWSSSNTTIATVGSSTGVVTGVSAGIVMITYMLPTGCFATYSVTVNPMPTAITSSTGLALGPICVGNTLTLFSAPAGGIWTSGTPTVATVGSSSGIVTGVSPGTSVITYTLPGGCFVTYTVTVNPNPVITGPSAVCVGSTINLTGTPPGGTWSSSSTTIATVGSGTGIVTGVSSGVAIITYMLPTGCFATWSVTVNTTPSLGVTGPIRLCTGSSFTLFATPTGGIWTSGNTAIATVGSLSGVITGISPGVVNITYTLSTGCFTSVTITINLTPVITGPSVVCVGSSINLTGTPPGGIWSSGSPGIAVVGSSSGIVTGISAGTAVITYMLPTGCYATTTITVNPVPVLGPSIGLHVCVGSTLTLTATPPGGVWTSSNTTIATIGSSSGVVTGISPGVVVITYTLPTGCMATNVVSVDPTPVITGPTQVCVGSSINLTGTPGGGTWISGSPGIASVGSSSGIVTGVAPGTAVITYVLSTGCSASVTVTVDPTPTPIVGSSIGSVICVGTTLTLSSTPPGGIWTSSNTTIATVGSTSGIVTTLAPGTVTITYTLPSGCFVSTFITIIPAPSPITGITTVCVGGTTILSCPGGGTWSSANPAIATVGSATGVVTGISVGSVVITYTLPSGCYTTTTVNVVSGVGPITGTLSICVGSTTTLTGPGGGVWSSGSPSVASIGSSSGVVTGVSAGTAVITYTLTSGCISTAVVTVNPLPGPITGPPSACVGSTATYSCLPPGGTWSSSNTSVATIGSATGILTGLTPGTTVITYTLPTGCSISRTVVVNPSPGPITGPNTLCVGSVITLTGPGGGTWSSSNPAVATVSGSGIVTGVAAGTANITYMLSTGCFSIYPVTVNPKPSPIVGPAWVCVGLSVTLTSTPPGGVWTSSNPAVATVGSTSGVVTGVSAGSVVITYTLPGGCFVLFTIPVKPAPCWPAAVQNVTNDPGMEIFPNPAYDELTIKTENGVFTNYTITNEVGQVVIGGQMKGTQASVDLKLLTPGLYYITVKGEYGNVVRKFVKM